MAKTRGKGSIIQLDKGPDGKKQKSKCRKWRLVVSLGKDPRTGKYPQKARAFHGTYTEAQKALREFIEEIEHGKVVKKNTWTYNEYAQHYAEQREKAGELTPKALKSMKSDLAGLGFLIGHLKLQEITPECLESAYVDLKNGDSRSGRKLTGTTVTCYHKAASRMMDCARKDGYISSNPFDDATPPRTDTKEKASMNASDYNELITKLDPNDGMQCAVLLCATLGLRRGEACGLSWGDVDFGDGTVFIQHSYDESGNLKAPKTESGVRILPMPEFLANALKSRKAHLLAELGGESKGSTVKRDDGTVDFKPEVPVCTDEFGARIEPQPLSSWWTYRRKKFGADGISLHQLRHTFLSLAAEQGIHPSVMQKLAGHASPNITMKIYTHVNVEAKKSAIDAMEKAYMAERKAS